MSKPTAYPLWATLDELDPVLGTPNKVVPSLEKQDYGQRANRNTLRQDINYLFNKIREWIEFFDKQSKVGDVHIATTASSPTATSVGNQLGGTWLEIDGVTGIQNPFAGVSVTVFKRIL